jgi:WD40 repeat protein
LLHLWNPFTGNEVCNQPVAAYQAAFSSDDRWLGYQVTESKFGLFEVASAHECKLLSFARPPGNESNAFAFSPDGQVLFSAHPDGVRVWDLRRRSLIAFERGGETRSLLLHPAGGSLITGGSDGLKVWPVSLPSIQTGAQFTFGIAETLSSEPLPHPITMDRSATTLAFVSEGAVQLLELKTRSSKARLQTETPFEFASLSPDGRWCAAAAQHAQTVSVFEVASGTPLRLLSATNVTTLAFSPDERWLVTGGKEEYSFWNTASWQRAWTLQRDMAGDTWGQIAFSPGGRVAAILCSGRLVRLVDPASGAQFATLEPAERGHFNRLGFSQDGSVLAVEGPGGTIHLWDLRLIRSELAAMNLDWELPPYPGVVAPATAER